MDKVTNLNSFEDFRTHLLDLIFHSQAPLPFSISVDADMKDAVHHSLGFTGPSLFCLILLTMRKVILVKLNF